MPDAQALIKAEKLRAKAESMIDNYLTDYYNMPAEIMRSVQACCGGSLETVMGFIEQFADAGADHIVLRLVGDHHTALEQIAASR